MQPNNIAQAKTFLLRNLSGYKGFWAVAGGWAIDFYLGKQTRSHKDIEVAVWRDQQAKLKKLLSQWECKYYQSGKAQVWMKGQELRLPIHEIHCRRGSLELEVLLNERKNGKWVFRRSKNISYPVRKFSFLSPAGIRVLSPEIVLLYKSQNPKQKDNRDFKNCINALTQSQKQWLSESIAKQNKSHPWLKQLA